MFVVFLIRQPAPSPMVIQAPAPPPVVLPAPSCPEPMACPINPLSFRNNQLPTLSQSLSHRRLAIVMPFIQSQVERVVSNMQQWEPFAACRLDSNGKTIASGAKISIVLYFDKNLKQAPPLDDGRTIEQYFQDEWKKLDPQVTKCVSGGLHFVSADLADEENTHPDGPCLQHFRLYSLLERNFDHFLQMEPDVLPIQDYWMDGLVAESNQVNCNSFWMKGSMSRCDGRYGEIARRHDFHINGNSLYCLGSPQFADFIRKVQAYYPPLGGPRHSVAGCVTGKWAEDGWDHTFFQFRQQAENFDYAKNVNHKFVYSTFIQNLCEDEYEVRDVLARDPNTLLVHSKFPLIPRHDQFVRREYVRILGRYALPLEREPLLAMSEEKVLKVLCRHPEHEKFLLTSLDPNPPPPLTRTRQQALRQAVDAARRCMDYYSPDSVPSALKSLWALEPTLVVPPKLIKPNTPSSPASPISPSVASPARSTLSFLLLIFIFLAAIILCAVGGWRLARLTGPSYNPIASI